MKTDRQEKILKLIKEKVILTQEDLQKELSLLGFQATQSTVSRDIKDLRIVKGHDAEGRYRYIAASPATTKGRQHLIDVFARSAQSMDYALNNVVIKCYTGMASSACVALDELYGDRMLGSLAGEDTIIIVMRSEAESAALIAELEKLL